MSTPSACSAADVALWHAGGEVRFEAIGSKLHINGVRLHIKGVNWFGSEGRAGPPLGLDKHESALARDRRHPGRALRVPDGGRALRPGRPGSAGAESSGQRSASAPQKLS